MEEVELSFQIIKASQVLIISHFQGKSQLYKRFIRLAKKTAGIYTNSSFVIRYHTKSRSL